MNNYYIYPSLLDKYQRYLNAEKDFEHWSNVDAQGEYKKSYEEICEERKQSLIDSINRVPFESDVADKGTAFNDVVDAFATGCVMSGTEISLDGDTVVSRFNGKEFRFPKSLVDEASEPYKESTPQLRVEAPLEIAQGIVHLYGYIDELVKDKVYDIKTTSRYDFGKFKQGWQRYVYPYCLVESGAMANVESFTYDVWVWNKAGATNYKEFYNNNHEYDRQELKYICESFVDFLEDNRELITDKKIFGLIID